MDSTKVTKSILVDAVYADVQCEKQVVASVLDSLLGSIKTSLKNGSTIELRGFGTLELRLRHGRSNARNPRTGEKFSSKPHYVAVFRPGKELRESLLEIPVSPEDLR